MGNGFFKQMTIFCLSAALTLSGSFLVQAAVYNNHNDPEVYVSGTRINGVNAAGWTPEEAKAGIEAFYGSGYTLTLAGKDGKEEVIQGSEIGMTAVLGEGLAEILAKENENGRISGPAVNNIYDLPMEISYSREVLLNRLEALELVTGRDIVKTENAHIVKHPNGEGFVIVPETEGTDLNMERFTQAVEAALASRQPVLNLAEAGCYQEISVRSQDRSLLTLLDAMNHCGDMTITYRFGDAVKELTGEVISTWITGTDGTAVTVDPVQAAAYVKTLADEYDTAGKPHLFRTASGQDVTVTGPYGWKINQEAETQALIEAVQTCRSSEREPVYSQTAASRTGNDYGMTYVEVDLENQHLYLVENGQCILDTPFVSGNVSKGWTTPPGIFGLTYKQKDKVLKGKDYATPVKYWMPFNGGIGLHDADWRGSFGGTIYKTSGSHGCINLPPEKAAIIYEHVYKNMPVICHN